MPLNKIHFMTNIKLLHVLSPGGHPEGVLEQRNTSPMCLSRYRSTLTGMVKIHKHKIIITVFNCICPHTLGLMFDYHLYVLHRL